MVSTFNFIGLTLTLSQLPIVCKCIVLTKLAASIWFHFTLLSEHGHLSLLLAPKRWLQDGDGP